MRKHGCCAFMMKSSIPSFKKKTAIRGKRESRALRLIEREAKSLRLRARDAVEQLPPQLGERIHNKREAAGQSGCRTSPPAVLAGYPDRLHTIIAFNSSRALDGTLRRVNSAALRSPLTGFIRQGVAIFPFSDRNRRHRSRLIVSASRDGAAAPHSAFRIALGNSMARVMPRSVRTSTTSY